VKWLFPHDKTDITYVFPEFVLTMSSIEVLEIFHLSLKSIMIQSEVQKDSSCLLGSYFIKQNIKIILIAGVPSSHALPGFLITAPPSVCVPDVTGVLAVWIQNPIKTKNSSPK